MRHLLSGRKFSRDCGARKALLRALTTSLFLHGRIETTLAKAKDLRPIAEKLVTVAKKGRSNLAAVRKLHSFIYQDDAISKAFDIAEKSMSRNGGYIRILKNNFRKGDAAPVAIIEFVDISSSSVVS